jgi:membrane protein
MAFQEAIKRSGKSVWKVLMRTFHVYGQIDGEQRAAAFAYYVLFSLFPLMALLLTLGSMFFGADEIVEAIGGILPLVPEQQKFLWEAVDALERSRGGVSVISAIVLLWCSLRFFQALVRGVNRAWHTVEIPWWQVPLKNLAMLAVIGSALFAGLLIPAVLQAAGELLRGAEDYLQTYFPAFNFRLASLALDTVRYVLGALVLFYSFSMLYMTAPRKRVRFRQVWVAALVVTAALQIVQMAFVNILPHFINYGIYGAVGGMMLVLMWVYFSGITIMVGACLCAALSPEIAETIPSTPKC